MRATPPSNVSDWWRIFAMGVVLAGMLFLVFFYEPGSGLPEGSGPPVRPIRVSTPSLDVAKLELAEDATREERLVIEAQPLAHLLERSLDIVPSVAKALGLPDEQVPISRLRANPDKFRGRYLWYKGQLEYISRGKAGHPVEGYRIYEGWLTTDTGDDVRFFVSLEPRDVEVGDFVRVEGFFMKLHDSNDMPKTEQAPVLVGPEVFEDFPPWTPVAELDPEIMSEVDDTWNRADPRSYEGGAWDELQESQYLPLWHLTSYARTKAESMSDAEWRAVKPFVAKEQFDRIRERETARGTPMRLLGAFVEGKYWEARPNPLGIRHWSEALIQVHDLGGKIVPVWIPGKLEHARRGASVDVRAFYFRLRLYEALDNNMVIAPVFVAANLDAFNPPPQHAAASVVKWVFLAVVVAVIGLFIGLGLRDRRRHEQHQQHLDERRRRRRTQRAALASE